MTCVDSFGLAVPCDGREAYVRHARKAAAFHDHGALRVVESWGDDVPEGKLTDFRRAVALDETVVVGWIGRPDKAARYAASPKATADPRMGDEAMPFDAKRMIYGGFETLLVADAPALRKVFRAEATVDDYDREARAAKEAAP